MRGTYTNFCGIDIGKDSFVTHFRGDDKTHEYENNARGFQTFFERHRKALVNSLVVLETTGGYESGCLEFLLEKNTAVHRTDNRKVKNFIRSWGQNGKTDTLDAKALSRYGYERCDSLTVFQKTEKRQQELQLLTERRKDLVDMLVQEKNRYQAPLNKSLHSTIKPIIRCLEKQVDKIEESINKLISECEILSRKKKILLTIPGVGEITSISLLSLVPELGKLNRKQIASLCGAAPFPKESGGKKYYRRTYGGRRNMRPILYMAAMGARRKKGSSLAVFFDRLTKNGKKPLVALVALMRKIVVIANARIKEAFYEAI